MRPLLLPLACLATLTVPFAPAQEPAAVATVRNAPGFHAAAEAQFNGYEVALSTHCATVQPDWPKATHLLYGKAEAAMDGNLVSATWVESVPGTACGQSRRYRVLVLIRSGKASVMSVFPGDSYAGPQLEHDAKLPLAGAVAGSLPKGKSCPVDVLDTRLVNGPPTAPKQAWTEDWTVAACGARFRVPIQFVPDMVGDGTSIHIESKAVNMLPPR